MKFKGNNDSILKIYPKLLNNAEEFRRISDTVTKANIKIKVSRVHGTIDNLADNLGKINGLHFSGHGETTDVIEKSFLRKKEGGKEILGLSDAQVVEYTEKGHALILEQGNLEGEFLH